jgi:hypothetical protein
LIFFVWIRYFNQLNSFHFRKTPDKNFLLHYFFRFILVLRIELNEKIFDSNRFILSNLDILTHYDNYWQQKKYPENPISIHYMGYVVTVVTIIFNF